MIQALIREYKLDGWMVQKNTYTGDFYIGGQMVPDQIKIVNGKPVRNKSVFNPKLQEPLNKMLTDYETGKLAQILAEPDVFKTIIPRYTFGDKEVLKTACEKEGYPNTTVNGFMQYENTHFATPKEAYYKLLRNTHAGLSFTWDSFKYRFHEFKACSYRFFKAIFYYCYARTLGHFLISDELAYYNGKQRRHNEH